jgi:hypothetical protein
MLHPGRIQEITCFLKQQWQHRKKNDTTFLSGMAHAQTLEVMTDYEYAEIYHGSKKLNQWQVLVRFSPFGNVIHQDLESHRVWSMMSTLFQQGPP